MLWWIWGLDCKWLPQHEYEGNLNISYNVFSRHGFVCREYGPRNSSVSRTSTEPGHLQSRLFRLRGRREILARDGQKTHPTVRWQPKWICQNWRSVEEREKLRKHIDLLCSVWNSTVLPGLHFIEWLPCIRIKSRRNQNAVHANGQPVRFLSPVPHHQQPETEVVVR